MTSTPVLFAVCLALIVAALLLVRATPAHANPSSFMRSSTSASNNTLTATSSVTTSITAGTATTTVVLNGTLGSNFAPNTVALSIFRMASSGRLINKIDIQYSMNCDATVPDWYSSHGSSTAAVTGPIILPFASTTAFSGGLPADSDQTLMQLGNVPTRCVRAVITTPIGVTGTSSVYAELTGKKEVQ